MSPLLVGILGGLIVAGVAGTVGLIRQIFFPSPVLPVPGKAGGDYGYVSRSWYFYWLTYQLHANPPVWEEASLELKVRGDQIKGKMQRTQIDHKIIDYKIKGNVRSNRMLLIDTCEQHPGDYVATYYSNVRALDLVGHTAGIWTGINDRDQPTAGPCILSKEIMPPDKRNQLVLASGLFLIQPGNYGAASRVMSQLFQSE